MKVIVALLGEYALEVSKSRFRMGNIFNLTNDVVGKVLEGVDYYLTYEYNPNCASGQK